MTFPDNHTRILMVVTSNAKLGETGRATGLWMEELAAPYNLFRDAGFEVTIASPLGGAAPVDDASLGAGFVTSDVTRFRDGARTMENLANTTRLAAIEDMTGFAAIFLVGGHGTMWDFSPNDDLDRLLDDADKRGVVIAAVCHGVAGLLGASRSGFVAGRKLTGFSDAEEAAVGLTEVVPFLLETQLRAAGAIVETGPAFHPKVVVDGRLITGQNPTSSLGAAQEVARILANR